MKKVGLFLVIAVFSMKVSAQTIVTDTIKFASDKKDIGIFLNLIHVAGLDSMYTGQPVTIFAPDNSAFEKLPAAMLDSLSKPANRQKLIALLNGHIVFGELSAKDIGMRIRKSLLFRENNGMAYFLLYTLSGNKLIVKINDNRNIFLTDENGGESIICQFDIQHINATFFIIKTVLLAKK
jgi:uncharacterized surface protein with fasciclin (FAS1) repeats